jgi:hypothetical protein
MKQQTDKRKQSRRRSVQQKVWQESRPEKVQRARRLIEDKGYPSKEVLQTVADLLSKKLKTTERRH